MMGGFGMFGGGRNFNFDPISRFAAYRVSSDEEELTILKQWLADRLAFLDKNISRFDTDWEPRIQVPKEIKSLFGGFGGGGFGGGGFGGFGGGGFGGGFGGGSPFPRMQ